MKIRFVLVLALAAIARFCQGSPLPDFPFVSVEGHAEVQVAPDIGKLFFTVRAHHADPAKALAVVEDRSRQIFALFSEMKIQREDIAADEIGKHLWTDKDLPSELQGEGRMKALGYELTRPFSVTVRDLRAFDRLMTKLLSLEDVIDIETHFDRSDRKKLEAELTAKASQDAREEAARLAKGFGTELGPVFALSKRGFSSLGEDFGVSGIEDFGPGEPKSKGFAKDLVPFVPSTIAIETSVKAVFRLRTDTK